MKRIALATVHRTLNYGTMLQMYACNKLFNDLGYDILVIDYQRKNDYKKDDFGNLYSYYKKRLDMSQNYKLRNRILSLAKAISTYKDNKRFFDNCNIFMLEHFHLSKPYFSIDELKSCPPDAEIYCAGSDQIWNSDYNGSIDPVYFLQFLDNACSRFSFSSSIGKDSLSSKEQTLFKEYLGMFDAVSVREQSAKFMLKDCGIETTHIVDPTLLLESTEWDYLCDNRRRVNEPYLLLYKLKANNFIDQIAATISKTKGIPIVRVSFSSVSKVKDEMSVVLPTIPEFLSLIKNADYIVTNSFHGTCFSINYAKEFTTIPRENYNSRILNILDTLRLEDRYCASINDLEKQYNKIDYQKVTEILINKRKEGKQWLSDTISMIESMRSVN